MSNSRKRKIEKMNLVLLGESGSGKSASGNTILGMKAFTSKPSPMPVTTECETCTKSICGTEVKVIDTPDLFDDDLQEKSTDIQRCRELCVGCRCVYLLVIQIGRFTEGERNCLKRLEKALKTKVSNRAIILFTHGDDLTCNINDYVRDTYPELKILIDNCGGRYHLFNNKANPTTQFSCPQSSQLFQGFFSCFGCGSTTTDAENQVNELMNMIVELVQMTDYSDIAKHDARESGCVII